MYFILILFTVLWPARNASVGGRGRCGKSANFDDAIEAHQTKYHWPAVCFLCADPRKDREGNGLQGQQRSAEPPHSLQVHLLNINLFLVEDRNSVNFVAGLWIRSDLIRIRIQFRFRIQAKTEHSKTISFSNFVEIKIWVKSNKKYRCYSCKFCSKSS
jgi:hypothetical protein